MVKHLITVKSIKKLGYCCDIQHFKITTRTIALYRDISKFQKFYIIFRMSILMPFIHTVYFK